MLTIKSWSMTCAKSRKSSKKKDGQTERANNEEPVIRKPDARLVTEPEPEPEPYEYQPLMATDMIRVLSLKPGDFQAPLVVTLSAQPLDRLPEIEALSYVWGKPSRTHAITCNKNTLRITSNLEAALRGIRHPADDIQLWVDAICINQDNVHERNHQVKHFAEIYSKARNVLVWLGPDADGSIAAAFIFAQRLTTEPAFAEWVLKDAWASRPVTNALKTLASRTWFRRIWTMQEIGLATSATFVSGGARMEWETLFQAYDTLNRRMSFNDRRLLKFAPDKVVFLHWKSTEEKLSFLELLDMAQQRETTDPRDRVFALLSHPAARTEAQLTLSATMFKEQEPPATTMLIEPDYTKELGQVYTAVAERLILTTGSLDVFSHIRGSTALEDDIATWAPEWHRRRTSHCLLDSNPRFSACGPAENWPGTTTTPHFDDKAIRTFLRDGTPAPEKTFRRIRLQRGFTQTANWHLTFPRLKRTTAHSSFELHNCIKDCWRMARTRCWDYTSGESEFLKAFGDTLTCGLLFYDRHYADDIKALFLEHFSAYWRYIWMHYNREANIPLLSGNSPREASTGAGSSSMAYFTSAVEYTCSGRSFFTTANGYMGLGPAGMKDGDVVSVLKGGRVPYLLRKSGGEEFWLVGECYVHGIMQGETVTEGLQTEKIHLI